MDLSTLIFRVETGQLKAAIDLVDKLGEATKALGQDVQQLATVDKNAAAAALMMAKARKENALAAAAEAKANKAATAETIAKANAEVKAATAAEKKAAAETRSTAATETNTRAVKTQTDYLGRQKDILSFMGEGYSRGQASILASAKAAGQLSDELGQVLQVQRKLIGGDPFDKSIGGLIAMKNQYAELKDEMRASGAGIEMTSKQYRELARDKMRIIEIMKTQGASFSEIRQKIRDYQAEFIGVTSKVNQLTAAERENERQSKLQANAMVNAAKASSFVETEMRRAENALEGLNSELNISSSNRLLKFQNQLKLSGKSIQEQTELMKQYEDVIKTTDKTRAKQQTNRQRTDDDRRVQLLSRSLAPQISDVLVSLQGGMNPFTVLMQQGMQVRDLMQLSGVEAGRMGEAFKAAGAGMVSTTAAAAKAIGGLLVGVFVDLGKTITDVAVSKIPFLRKNLNALTLSLAIVADTGTPLQSSIANIGLEIGKLVPLLAGVGIGLFVAGLAALAVASIQVIKEQSAMSKALAMTGASLGLTKDQAVELSASIDGLSATKGVETLTEMAKAGGFAKEQFELVAEAAARMQKFAGVAIGDTVKNFAELQKKPTESLLEFAKANGMIEIASIKKVQQLEKDGKITEAIALATTLYGESLVDVAALIESELSPMESLWIDIKSAISGAWDEVKKFAGASAVVAPFRTAFEVIAVIVSEVWYVLKSVGNEIGGIAAQIAAVIKGDFAGAGRIHDDMVANAKDARAAQDAYVKSIVDGTKAKREDIKTETERVKNSKAAEALIRSIKDSKKKTPKTAAEKADDTLLKFRDSMKAATAESEYFDGSLSSAEKALMKLQETKAWREGSPGMKLQAEQAAKAADAAERYKNGIDAIKNSLMQLAGIQLDSAMLDYESSLIASGMDPQQMKLAISMQREAMQLQNEIFKIQNMTVTEEQKKTLILIEQEKTKGRILNLYQQEKNTIDAQIAAMQKSTNEQTALLDYELSITGLVADERQRLLEIKKLELEMQKELDKTQNPEQQAAIRAIYNQKIQNVNKKVANDLNMRLTDGVTDAIMTGLIEGGEAGKKKLRDLIVAELQRPITIFIRAVISDIVNMVTGTGSTTNSLLGQAASNYMSTGSIFGNTGSVAGASGSGLNAAGAAYQSSMAQGNGYWESAKAGYAAYGGNAAVAAQYGTAVGSQQTAMLASQQAGMGAGGATSAMGYMGYAALIVAAVMIAENLYEKGYTRAAVGKGPNESYKVSQHSNYTADNNMGRSSIYNASLENFTRRTMDMFGMSEKWADILSGTVRMGTLFGRKLKEVGLQADIRGADVDAKGYAKYKGGLFRSNKTVGFDADSRDLQQFETQVEAMRQQTRTLALSLGHSTEAIDNFNGSIRVNFKGAESNEEITKRYTEAMEKLQMQMLNSIPGLKMTKESFKQMQEEALKLAEGAGYSASNVANIIRDGMLGRMTEAQVGEALAEQIIGSIYNALAGGFAEQITGAITGLIIQPIMTSILAGGTVSAAVSQVSIQAVLTTAKNAIDAFTQILNDPAIQGMFADINKMVGTLSGVVVKPVKSIKTFTSSMRSAGNAAAEAAKAAAEAAKKIADERYALEGKLLEALGQTAKLRQRELAGIHASNRALQLHIWALEDAKSTYDAVYSASEDALDKLNEVKDGLKEIFDFLADSIREIRGEVDSTAKMQQGEALAYLQAIASGSTVAEIKKIEEAVGAVRDGIDNTSFVTQVDQSREKLRLAALLDQVKSTVGLDLDQKSQEAILLEAQLELSKQQINALLGIQENTYTTTEAIAALKNAVTNYSSVIAAAANAATAASSGAAPVSVAAPVSRGSFGGGGGRYKAPKSPATWTADGYFAKNQDLQAEYAALRAADPRETDKRFTQSPELSYRDEYLWWHWTNYGQREKRRYAKGGAFTNGVVQRPTTFNIGEMGEAGPEAIMPLTNVGGSLGVRAVGSDNSGLLEKVEMLQVAIDTMVISTNKLQRQFNNARGEDGTSLNVTIVNTTTNPVPTDEVV